MPNISNLVRAYATPTLLEERTTILHDAMQHIIQESGHLPSGIYNELFSWFTKSGVEDLNKPLVMTKNGLTPVSFPQGLPQGHHWAPKYHTHGKISQWEAYNPIEIEVKFSKYGRERPKFKTQEQVAIAMSTDAFNFSHALEFFKQMLIGLTFQTIDEWKKNGASKTDGTDGINAELHDLYFPATGATTGYPSHQQDLSLEQGFLCHKDGKFTPCKTANGGDKAYQVTTNAFKDIMTALQKLIKTNEITATASSMKGFETQGSADYKKLAGWVQKIKEIVLEMKTICTSKYNIGMTNTTGEPAACDESLKKHGINLGCCTKCVGTDKKCSCYNQTYAKTEDLGLFMNYKDVLAIEEIFPLINHSERMSIISQNLGVGKIFIMNEIPIGEALVLNRKTIGIHPIYSETGAADYDEPKLHNIWFRLRFHLVLWPYHAVTIKKAV